MAAIKALLKFAIEKPVTISLVINKSIAFITKVNKPKVIMLIGNVKIVKIGLINKHKIPQTTEITINGKSPTIIKPGTM